MITVTDLKRQPGDSVKQYQVSAFADTKEEVVPGAEFIGMPTDGEMQHGSSIVTADGEIGYLKSDGTWNWTQLGLFPVVQGTQLII